MPAFDGYEKVGDASREPGDCLFDVEVPFVQKTDSDSPDVAFETCDAIVMFQRCDLPKLGMRLLCPVWPREPAAGMHQDFGRNEGLANRRKGRYAQFHRLNRCEIPSWERDCMLVQCNHSLVLDKAIMADHLAQPNPRLRLLPPDRERLAQAFALFYAGRPAKRAFCAVGPGAWDVAGAGPRTGDAGDWAPPRISRGRRAAG